MAGSPGAIYNDLHVYGTGVRVICGSFAPNGGSTLDATKVKGKGFTVAHSATGLFTVTLGTGKRYLALLSGQVTPQFAAATASDLQLRAVDVTTAGTIQIANSPSGSDTDIAANAANRIHFVLFCGASKANS